MNPATEKEISAEEGLALLGRGFRRVIQYPAIYVFELHDGRTLSFEPASYDYSESWWLDTQPQTVQEDIAVRVVAIEQEPPLRKVPAHEFEACQAVGHEWSPAGGGMQICEMCEETRWGDEDPPF